jgi:hypothetical protein
LLEQVSKTLLACALGLAASLAQYCISNEIPEHDQPIDEGYGPRPLTVKAD